MIEIFIEGLLVLIFLAKAGFIGFTPFFIDTIIKSGFGIFNKVTVIIIVLIIDVILLGMFAQSIK